MCHLFYQNRTHKSKARGIRPGLFRVQIEHRYFTVVISFFTDASTYLYLSKTSIALLSNHIRILPFEKGIPHSEGCGGYTLRAITLWTEIIRQDSHLFWSTLLSLLHFNKSLRSTPMLLTKYIILSFTIVLFKFIGHIDSRLINRNVTVSYRFK